jgi:hypothetical protein
MKRIVTLSVAALVAAQAGAQVQFHWAKRQAAQMPQPAAANRQQAYLDAQRQLQMQRQQTQMISNMLRMQHETNMAIINNIGGESTTSTPTYNCYDTDGNCIRPAY